MSFTVEKIVDEPILLVKILEGYRVREHQFFSDSEARAIMDSASEKLFHIVDVTDFKLNFDDVLAAANTGARGQAPVWHHPNTRAMIFVSPNPIVKLAASGLASGAFGGLEAKVFPNLGEALAWIREQG